MPYKTQASENFFSKGREVCIERDERIITFGKIRIGMLSRHGQIYCSFLSEEPVLRMFTILESNEALECINSELEETSYAMPCSRGNDVAITRRDQPEYLTR